MSTPVKYIVVYDFIKTTHFGNKLPPFMYINTIVQSFVYVSCI